MSIIYDALKKVERAHQDDPQVGPDIETKKRLSPTLRVYLVYALALCLGAWVMNAMFFLLSKSPHGIVNNQPQLQAKASSVVSTAKEDVYGYAPVSPAVMKAASAANSGRMSFSLNGIFFSEDEGFALINNQIVKQGDTIEGAKILRISVNEVELDLDGSVFKLSSGS